MHQTKVPVLIVMIKMGAFAFFQDQMDSLGLPVSAHRVRPTGLDRREQGDESLADLVLPGQTAGQFLFGEFGVLQILHRSSGPFRGGVGFGFDAVGPLLREVLEIFNQHAAHAQIRLHGFGVEEHPQAALEKQPVKTTKNACDMLAEFGKKSVRDAVSKGR